MLAALVPAQPVMAQGRLDAQYEGILGGILVGRGAWRIDITEDQYAAAAQGGSSGIMKAFSGGSGSGSAAGKVVNGQLQPSGCHRHHLRLAQIRDYPHHAGRRRHQGFQHHRNRPGQRPYSDPEAHRRGVVDPMTGSMMRVSGTGDLMSAEVCHTATAILTDGCATT
ncbi:MAG: DUF3108 domain-containing protein [Rhodopseudomonas palustris]|nr:DUF3108 domain-containing protein [Rhodopseudomonas palustris]